MDVLSRDRYLDLLKRVLTDTLFDAEPVPEDSQRYFTKFVKHYIHGRALTMLPTVRLDNLQHCVIDVIERETPGDFIETGVWRGGATIFMRAILSIYGVTNRRVWVADSFEGLPEPDPEKYPVEAKAHQGRVMKEVYNHFAVDIDAVRANFARFGLLDDSVCFLKGWFKDTLPSAPIDSIAIMRLDGDYYESTIDSLMSLYPKLARGGYVIIDDYGEETWTHCRRAVDEFRAAHHIEAPLMKIDEKAVYWQKPS